VHDNLNRGGKTMRKQSLIFLLSSLLLLVLFTGCLTPLQEAVKSGDLEMTRQLIDQGADVNDKSDHSTPLCHAAIVGHKEIAELLISKGAVVDQLNTCYYGTPLNAAAYSGRNDVVKLLIANGADPRKTSNGWTPRRYAEARGFNEIASLLKNAEAEGPRRVETATEESQEVARFEKVVQNYRNSASKPALPEEARKYKIQAEVAVRDKKYEMAAELYEKGLNIALWWPEGHFNRALVLGESRYYLTAMREMKRYLQLMPEAPDARAAQDKIYEWELKAK